MVFGGSARWLTGGGMGPGGGRRWGNRNRRDGGWDQDGVAGNVSEFRAHHTGGTPLAQMAHSNGWSLLQSMPTYEDGTDLDLSGGPFAVGRYHPIPPIVQGQAGYWTFWALSVSAMTRGAQWRSYALTFMQLGGAVPFVHVYPEAWRASITSVTQEVHLESGAFNDRFATFAKDAQTVYGLLNPRTMQLLLDSPPVDEIWTAGQFVCISRIDAHHGEALGAHLNLLTSIAVGVPSSLFERGL